MPKNQSISTNDDDKRAAYAAIVDYHNNLVQMRFTVAGLFLAANGFLVGSYFQQFGSKIPQVALPVLGIALAFICWLLEVRNYQLLENLSVRGNDLEKSLNLHEALGFFSLLMHQSIGPRFSPTRLWMPRNRFVQYIVSHSFGIGLLYILIGLFWIIIPIVLFMGV